MTFLDFKIFCLFAVCKLLDSPFKGTALDDCAQIGLHN